MADDTTQGKSRFEPPPWEQEAFEALARKRAEKEESERIAREALAAAEKKAAESAVPATAAVQPDASPDEAPAQVAPQVQQAVEPAAEVAAVDEPAAAAVPAGPKLDESEVEAMLFQLRAQEVSTTRSTVMIGRVAAMLTAVIGAAMVIGGVLAGSATKGNPAGIVGSAVMSVFGLGFIAMSVWVWLNASRSKGIR